MAFEGIDGSGKSTVARRVARILRRAGHRVVVTQEPTRTWLGRAVRRGIRSGVDPLALACLFLADRAVHANEMARHPPSTIVITDRYRDSTTAYQAVALDGRLPDALGFFSKLQASWFPAPDLAFLFDVRPQVGLARIRGRAVKEPFEKVRFLEKVRRNYRRLAQGNRLVLVDAERPVAKVAAEVAALVQRRIRSSRLRRVRAG